MIAIITVLLAFAAGYRFKTRIAANATYAVAYLWAFAFQTLYLLLDAIDPNSTNPAFEAGKFPLSYGLVTLAVFGTGFGLVEAGHRLATRRSRSRHQGGRHPHRLTEPSSTPGETAIGARATSRAWPLAAPGCRHWLDPVQTSRDFTIALRPHPVEHPPGGDSRGGD